jgi:hypothetical protein
VEEGEQSQTRGVKESSLMLDSRLREAGGGGGEIRNDGEEGRQ